MDDNYLSALAASSSIDEFILRQTINSGDDVRSLLSLYEADYCNKLKEFSVYANEFIKHGKVKFEDCISSELPIFAGFRYEKDPLTMANILRVLFYDCKGNLQNSVYVNLDLVEDMKEMHEIDVDAQINHILRYELIEAKKRC